MWERNGNRNELLIDTPETNRGLQNVMLANKVGFSEIRFIKSVDVKDLVAAMTGNFSFKPAPRGWDKVEA